MVFKILKNRVTDILFSERKQRNKSLENWDASTKKEINTEVVKLYLDGETGDAMVDLKTDPYLAEKIVKEKVKASGYYPEAQLPEDIEQLVKQSEMVKLKGKTIEEATLADILDAGMIDQVDFV